MKKIISIILASLSICGSAIAGPNDFVFIQRDAQDSQPQQRVIASPASNGFFTYFVGTKRGGYTTIGTGLTLDNGVLSATLTPGPQGPAGQNGTNGTNGIDGATGAKGDKGDKGDTGATGAPGTTDWNGITNKPTTLAGFGILDAYPLASNPAGYLTTVTQAQVTSALGMTPVSQAGARSAISLTTTGSGAATYNASTGVLNVPTPVAPTVPVINRTRATTAADGSYVWTLATACAAGTTPIVSITPESSTAGDPVSHRIVSATNTTVNVFAGRSPGLSVLGLTVLGVPAGAAIPVHLIAICP